MLIMMSCCSTSDSFLECISIGLQAWGICHHGKVAVGEGGLLTEQEGVVSLRDGEHAPVQQQ
jgi:hypothetical protein